MPLRRPPQFAGRYSASPGSDDDVGETRIVSAIAALPDGSKLTIITKTGSVVDVEVRNRGVYGVSLMHNGGELPYADVAQALFRVPVHLPEASATFSSGDFFRGLQPQHAGVPFQIRLVITDQEVRQVGHVSGTWVAPSPLPTRNDVIAVTTAVGSIEEVAAGERFSCIELDMVVFECSETEVAQATAARSLSGVPSSLSRRSTVVELAASASRHTSSLLRRESRVTTDFEYSAALIVSSSQHGLLRRRSTGATTTGEPRHMMEEPTGTTNNANAGGGEFPLPRPDMTHCNSGKHVHLCIPGDDTKDPDDDQSVTDWEMVRHIWERVSRVSIFEFMCTGLNPRKCNPYPIQTKGPGARRAADQADGQHPDEATAVPMGAFAVPVETNDTNEPLPNEDLPGMNWVRKHGTVWNVVSVVVMIGSFVCAGLLAASTQEDSGLPQRHGSWVSVHMLVFVFLPLSLAVFNIAARCRGVSMIGRRVDWCDDHVPHLRKLTPAMHYASTTREISSRYWGAIQILFANPLFVIAIVLGPTYMDNEAFTWFCFAAVLVASVMPVAFAVEIRHGERWLAYLVPRVLQQVDAVLGVPPVPDSCCCCCSFWLKPDADYEAQVMRISNHYRRAASRESHTRQRSASMIPGDARQIPGGPNAAPSGGDAAAQPSMAPPHPAWTVPVHTLLTFERAPVLESVSSTGSDSEPGDGDAAAAKASVPRNSQRSSHPLSFSTQHGD